MFRLGSVCLSVCLSFCLFVGIWVVARIRVSFGFPKREHAVVRVDLYRNNQSHHGFDRSYNTIQHLRLCIEALMHGSRALFRVCVSGV